MNKLLQYTGILFCLLISNASLLAQEQEIRWLTFEELEDSLAVAPKKVFVNFYADWCAYCKKMDNAAYKDPNIVQLLNTEYYAVKMNAESKKTVVFDGISYTNTQLGKSRNAIHEIPLLLASRENIPFSLPAMVVLDTSFVVTQRYFSYLSPKALRAILTSR